MGLLDDAIREHLDLKRRNGADPAEVERLEREALGPVRREPAPTNESVEAFEDHEEIDFEDHESMIAELDDTPAIHIDEEELPVVHDQTFAEPDEQVAAFDAAESADEPAEPDPEPTRKRRGLLGRLRGDHLEPEPAEDGEPFDPLAPDEQVARPADTASAASEVEPVDPHATQIHEQPEPAEERPTPQRPDFGALPGVAAPEPEVGPATEAHDVTQHFEQEDAHESAGAGAGGAGEPEAPAEPEVPEQQHDSGVEQPPPAAGEDEDLLEETPDFLQDTPDHDRLWFEQRPPKDFDFDG